ncbi:hypothetical protein EV561_110119 [Rhizobium sp. BK376]|nr:hypothetical protein EV561_110119 [Rhizobium sp. BK376]
MIIRPEQCAERGVTEKGEPPRKLEDNDMIRTTIIAVMLAGASAVPSFSASMAMMKCDNDSMTKVQSQVDAMTDAAKKKTAMKSLAMAQTDMKAHKMKSCATHMNNAMKSTM